MSSHALSESDEETGSFGKWSSSGHANGSLFNKCKESLIHFYKEYIIRNMGITLTLISQFFNSLMILFCKLLLMDPDFDEPMHPFQILFVRMTMTYIGCALYLGLYKRDPDFPLGPKGFRKLMMGRGVGGCISVAGQYFALLYLTISDTIVITFLSPIITSLMAYFFLRERFTRAEAVGGMLAFVGVIFISRPSFLFGDVGTDSITAGTEAGVTSSAEGDGRLLETNNPTLRLLGSFLALSATFGTGIAMCCIRKIAFHAHALLTVSFFALITVIVSFFGIILTPGLTFEIPRNTRQWVLLIALGVAGFIMQFLLTAGMQREKAARAIAMSYSQLIYASFFDLVIFNHWPSKLSFLGEMIITVAVVGIIYFKEEPTSSHDLEDLEDHDSISLSSLSIDDDDSIH
ncbi:hypothetical protein FOA43_004768 [Brettanomyces nanus]|uniref:EamA domain-containing protein n=1 Tax=Eeniella nana TaxID=13502 RepID=A0A875S7N0_EENNA|nr:uncharacterized protein FOA43_004768 [Brettanomyces nanus]QPG77356.1 hypothetical protein FOA43_004768 [Brettanomyces nanus]